MLLLAQKREMLVFGDFLFADGFLCCIAVLSFRAYPPLGDLRQLLLIRTACYCPAFVVHCVFEADELIPLALGTYGNRAHLPGIVVYSHQKYATALSLAACCTTRMIPAVNTFEYLNILYGISAPDWSAVTCQPTTRNQRQGAGDSPSQPPTGKSALSV
jgi:hypothetical protein